MKVGDFKINYSDGLFNCCADHIYEHRNDMAEVGMTITCDHCNIEMILVEMPDGMLQWCANR